MMKKLNLMMIILWSLIGVVILSIMVTGMFFNRGGGMSFGADTRNTQLVVDEAIPADGFDTVKIDLAADMCRVMPTDGDNILVKHYVRGISSDQYVKVLKQNGTLTVSRRTEFVFTSIFALNNYSMVEVYLPKDYNKNLDININSGTLDVEDALDLSGLGIKISSGTLRSQYGIKAGTVNIGVNSGTIKLTGGVETGEYGIKVSSGTITADGLKGSGNIEINSGTIKLSGVDIKDYLNVKASSGTINVEITGNPSLEFTGHKSSGTLRTYFANSGGDKDFSATTGSAPYKKLDARVNSGTISITHE